MQATDDNAEGQTPPSPMKATANDFYFDCFRIHVFDDQTAAGSFVANHECPLQVLGEPTGSQPTACARLAACLASQVLPAVAAACRRGLFRGYGAYRRGLFRG